MTRAATRRRVVFAVLTAGVALLGCEPAPGPLPAAQPWPGATALASAAAVARQEGKEAKETEERLAAENEPWRPVEIQLRGGDGERAVLTFHDDGEVHAPGLVELAGGGVWRRPNRLDIGLP